MKKRLIFKKYIIRISIILVLLFQSGIILYLWATKDDKIYEVNLVKINTQKDSLDLAPLRNDLLSIERTVGQINSFMKSKSIDVFPTKSLNLDSLSQRVYLARQSNRYSQYLVDLQQKLQYMPLGMPTEGYISSNFGKRINPIPFIKKIFTSSSAQQSSISVPVAEVPATPKRRKVIDAKIVEEKDSAGNIRKVVIPIYAKEEAPSIQRSETTKPASVSVGGIVKQASKKMHATPAEPDQIQFHKGIDIAVNNGSSVYCTASGTVIFAGQKGGYGNCVIISHGNGLSTLYAHLSQILVTPNQKVSNHQIIAKSGNSGRSTGPHLHYEVHRDNTPINPRLFID